MNWCSVFTKISSLREGAGNRTKILLLAGHVILKLGEQKRHLEITGTCRHACVSMQGGRRSQNKVPHPSVCSAVSVRGTELAVSQEVPCGLFMLPLPMQH